ncbi:uncharacterized protein LOC144363060 [Saccoglossus kowalevskii]
MQQEIKEWILQNYTLCRGSTVTIDEMLEHYMCEHKCTNVRSTRVNFGYAINTLWSRDGVYGKRIRLPGRNRRLKKYYNIKRIPSANMAVVDKLSWEDVKNYSPPGWIKVPSDVEIRITWVMLDSRIDLLVNGARILREVTFTKSGSFIHGEAKVGVASAPLLKANVPWNPGCVKIGTLKAVFDLVANGNPCIGDIKCNVSCEALCKVEVWGNRLNGMNSARRWRSKNCHILSCKNICPSCQHATRSDKFGAVNTSIVSRVQGYTVAGVEVLLNKLRQKRAQIGQNELITELKEQRPENVICIIED